MGWQGIGVYLQAAILALVLVTATVIFAERSSIGKGYVPVLIGCLLAGITILSDIMASAKLVSLVFGGREFTTTAGTLIFPVILLGQDYINEFYGQEVAMRMVYGGWIAKIFMAILLLVLLYATPAASYAQEQAEMANKVLGLTPRIGIASIVAYLISGTVNVKVYDWLRKATKERHLWLRNNASSNAAMLVDTAVFCTAAFVGALPSNVVLDISLTMIVVKIITNWLDTGFLYLMTYLKQGGWIKQELAIGK